MHPLFEKADKLSREVIAALIEVHREKGPGLIESIYERCFLRELELRNLTAINQRVVKIEYKGLVFEDNLRCDVLVEECLLVELKAVEKILPIHKAQLLSYMKLLDVPVGLLVNFHELTLVDGLHRLMLPGANTRLRCLGFLLYKKTEMKMNAGLQKETKRTKRAFTGNCFEQVVEPKNLRSAFGKAGQGKRSGRRAELPMPGTEWTGKDAYPTFFSPRSRL